MKLTKVDTFKFWARWCNWLLVRVSTDEGLVGWGEASLHGPVDAVESAVQDIGAVLLDTEFKGVEAHWHDMRHAWRWRGGPVQSSAVSGIDMALWDLEGQRLGVPVYRLLGGAIRNDVRAYASHWLGSAQSPQDAHDGAAEAVRLGFRGFKWTMSRLWDGGDELGSLARIKDFMAAAREGAGPTVEIYIECAERLSPRTARMVADELAPYRPGWFEEPIPFENSKAMADLHAQIAAPIATGERLLSRYEFRELFELNGCSIVQPDLMHAGGITEGRKIASLAETYFVPVAPHNPAGPIATLAGIHLAAAIPNFLVLETMADEHDLWDRICTEPPRLVDGTFTLPTRPGLGTDIDLDAITAMPYRPQPVLSGPEPWWR